LPVLDRGRSSCLWPLIILDPFMFARSLTWHPEAAELWKQLTSRVDSSHQPRGFSDLSSSWPVGSRKEKGPAISVLLVLFCTFHILYPKVFLTGIKDCLVKVLLCLSFSRFTICQHITHFLSQYTTQP
jgi:hypothetical protein